MSKKKENEKLITIKFEGVSYIFTKEAWEKGKQTVKNQKKKDNEKESKTD